MGQTSFVPSRIYTPKTKEASQPAETQVFPGGGPANDWFSGQTGQQVRVGVLLRIRGGGHLPGPPDRIPDRIHAESAPLAGAIREKGYTTKG